METMVHIHNRLNEDAWKLVLQWESRFHGGDAEAAKLELASFSGIHGHLSNKARFYKLGKRFFPSYFTLPDPFDRHDWIVSRPRTGTKARYVIDYYGAKNARGDTQLVMDARPALDSFDNGRMRVVAAIGRMLLVTSKVTRSADSALVKCGLCLLAIAIFVYIPRYV